MVSENFCLPNFNYISLKVCMSDNISDSSLVKMLLWYPNASFSLSDFREIYYK